MDNDQNLPDIFGDLKPKDSLDSLDSLFDDVIIEPVKKKAPTTKFRYHPDGWILPNPETILKQKLMKSLTEETCCSFTEWKDAGYWISKGAKSVFQDMLGVPQFTKEQVWKPSRRW